MQPPVLVAPGLHYLRTVMVNVYFADARPSGHDGWVLIDAGLSPAAETPIVEAAAELFGERPPSAIVLTHGHFDHIGALAALLDRWKVAAYAHSLELPYLTGRSNYPPGDPLAGGGSMSLLSRLYPNRAHDFGPRIRPLPEDRQVPGLPAWRWLHTPGHSPGHVSLFRESDRTLVSGDAVITVQQESLVAVLTQHKKVHGPPRYFTIDWDQARASAGRLADLEPEVLASGHGEPMRGAEMRRQLRELAGEFGRRAVPAFGRYAARPATTDLRGVVSLPPDPVPRVVRGAAAGAAVLAAVGLVLSVRRART